MGVKVIATLELEGEGCSYSGVYGLRERVWRGKGGEGKGRRLE